MGHWLAAQRDLRGGRKRAVIALIVMTLLVAGCANGRHQASAPAASFTDTLQEQLLRAERAGDQDSRKRSAEYLRIAAAGWGRFAGRDPSQAATDPAVALYNRAVADFVESWSKQNRPTNLQDDRTGTTSVLAPGPTTDGSWPADYFSNFESSRKVNRKGFWRSVEEPGLGGTLVGLHQDAPAGSPPPPLEPPQGFRVAVTAVLRFKKGPTTDRVELQLFDPRARSSVDIAGRNFLLAADFTAPIASYPSRNETWAGFVNMVRGEKTAARSGLYLLQPYDPNRIPVILVHGLLASGFMWRNVGNAIEDDPAIRKRYQFWVFFYPTGNPILASTLRLREDLALARQRFGLKHGVILIGHSMGGLVSRLQVTDLKRSTWRSISPAHSSELFALLAARPRLEHAFIFDANPLVKRVIFIATPHRGSSLASGGLAALGDRLIRLPLAVTRAVPKSLVGLIDPKLRKARLPTSIDGLSPKSPLLQALNHLPIRAPHHSIIGDRGRGDTPNSSDGVVPYWSSHLTTASSEVIVPTGHGAMNHPRAIAEIQRILRLHAGLRPRSPAQPGATPAAATAPLPPAASYQPTASQ
ncbi:MAG: alpha/beta fold hydrolase [Verrucomicrobia bacterium]|nr:alpha/beta fold hydrolase [Verrucomicrobiota bacterium]